MIPELKETTLILIGHGSTTNPDSSEPTHLHADHLRQRALFNEVRCAFWKEEPSLREVLYQISTPNVVIVPLFISEGYFTQKVIPRELALQGAVTIQGRHVLYYTPPVGSHPAITELILKKARSTAPELRPQETTLFIIGHGTALNKNSAKAVKEQVAFLQKNGSLR